MNDTELAALLARKLQHGITWPGDSKRKLPAKTIELPLRSGPGMPKEMTDLINETVKQLSEAIVHTIKTEAHLNLVPDDEHERLTIMEARTNGGQPFTAPVPVYCRCGVAIAVLTVTDAKRITVDGGQLIRVISKLDDKCPHDRKAS